MSFPHWLLCLCLYETLSQVETQTNNTVSTVNIITSSSKVTLLQETETSQIIRAIQLKVQIHEIGDTVGVMEKKIFLIATLTLIGDSLNFPK